MKLALVALLLVSSAAFAPPTSAQDTSKPATSSEKPSARTRAEQRRARAEARKEARKEARAEARKGARKAKRAKPETEPADPEVAEASDKPASEREADAAAASPPPPVEDGSEIRKEGDTDVKVMEFTGLDIEGQLKTPQLLYFLNRLRAEFGRPRLPHRSFMPELERSAGERPLR